MNLGPIEDSLLGYAVLSLAPILLWLYFFRNNLPQQKSYLLLTFVAGMLSVLPVKLYEKYWDTGLLYLSHLNLFKYMNDVLELGTLSSLLSYVLATIVVMVGIFLFVGVMMGCLELFSGDNSWRVFQRKLRRIFETPFFFITIAVVFGIVAFMGTLSLHEKVWLFMLVGVLEEFTKHLVLRFSDEEKIHSVGEAIQFAVVVALGFAFVENIQYFSNMGTLSLLSWPEFFLLVALRSLVSVGAHVSFSAILGYFYGVAKFASDIYQREVLEHRHKLLERLHQILHLKGEVLFHDQKMMEGALLAMVLHGIYNSLLEFGYVSAALPMVGLMLLVVLYLLHQKTLLQINGAILKRRFKNQTITQP